MLALTLSILFTALGIAVFPCWRYSARWGFGPTVAAGGLLILVAALTVSSRPSIEDARAFRAIAVAPNALTPSSPVEIATASPTGTVGDEHP